MIFQPTSLEGAHLIKMQQLSDDRGFFARAWCQREFEAQDLASRFVQCNVSFNPVAGTLRGMHFQLPPAQEDKLVRCTRGSVFDVILDLRPGSPTFCRWEGFHLDAENRDMVYVPAGFAHGYLTLQPDSEVFYQVSAFYEPKLSTGVRWDDPAFGIEWPATPVLISAQDRNFPDFRR